MMIYEISNMKSFMSKLLKEEVFDHFEARGIVLQTMTKFEISCILDKDYQQDAQEKQQYCRWGQLKPYIFELIKGKKTPQMLKIIFALEQERLPDIHNNASALFLNILYEGSKVTITTGTAQKDFSLDKQVDFSWEAYVEKFFLDNGVIAVKEPA